LRLTSSADAVNVARGSIGPLGGGAFVVATALAAVLGAVVLLSASSRPSVPPPAAAATPPFDPARASSCDPSAAVRVEHAPLVAGALLPEHWGLSAMAWLAFDGDSGEIVELADLEAGA
jgi:hypothetical protein